MASPLPGPAREENPSGAGQVGTGSGAAGGGWGAAGVLVAQLSAGGGGAAEGQAPSPTSTRPLRWYGRDCRRSAEQRHVHALPATGEGSRRAPVLPRGAGWPWEGWQGLLPRQFPAARPGRTRRKPDASCGRRCRRQSPALPPGPGPGVPPAGAAPRNLPPRMRYAT